MPPTKRRRLAPAPHSSTGNTIQRYARVTKAALAPSRSREAGDKASGLGDDGHCGIGAKRKRTQPVKSDRDAAVTPALAAKVTDPTPDSSEDVTTLRHGLLTPASTPQKERKRLKDIPLALSSPSPITPPTTPCKRKPPNNPATHCTDLPSELQDLAQMNAAFLKTLSLHCAHNGSVTPIDVRLLTQSFSKIWRKRRATVDDIRLCVGLLCTVKDPCAQFQLSDYGHNKICLERPDCHQTNSTIAAPVDERLLNTIFANTLEQKWAEWQAEHRTDEKSKSSAAFVSNLPRANVNESQTLSKTTSVLAKGHQRLVDIRSLVREARTDHLAISAAKLTPSAKKSNGTKLRQTSLLERLRAKAAEQSSQPAPPTVIELQRRAALQRAEEVAMILASPTSSRSSGARCTYALGALLELVQDSSKSQWSREEIERTVRLLADELAMDFIRLSKLGSAIAVVVDMGNRPHDLGARVAAALG